MRPERFDGPDAVHHVFNRARKRERVFASPSEREDFLTRLAELPDRFKMRVEAFVLMDTHYHLVLRSSGRLSASMQWLLGGFCRASNLRRDADGALFKGRFSNRRVRDDEYHAYLFSYLDRNPVEAGVCDRAACSGWSSHRAYAGLDAAPPWLSMESARSLIGGPQAYAEFVAAGQRRRPEGFDEEWLWGPASSLEVPAPRLTAAGLPAAEVLRVVPRGTFKVRPGCPVPADATAALQVLVEECGLTHVQAGRLVGLSRNTVTKRLRRRATPAVVQSRANLLQRLQ